MFWPKSEFWSEIEIMENDRNFSGQKKIFNEKKFLIKISQIFAAKVRGTSSWHETMVMNHELLPW